MMNTSLIEMTAESFGSLTFIVATKADMTVRTSHGNEKSFFAFRQRKAKGMLPKYKTSRYSLHARDCCCQRTLLSSASYGGRDYPPKARREHKSFLRSRLADGGHLAAVGSGAG